MLKDPIYGPYDLILDSGDTGSAGVNSDTAGTFAFRVQGLEMDSVSIDEVVEEVVLEDKVGRNLMRVATIVATFSDLDPTDIATIQSLGGGAKNHPVIQFPGINTELFLIDDAVADDGGYCVYKVEIEGSKTKITINRSSAVIATTQIQRNSTKTAYTAVS